MTTTAEDTVTDNQQPPAAAAPAAAAPAAAAPAAAVPAAAKPTAATPAEKKSEPPADQPSASGSDTQGTDGANNSDDADSADGDTPKAKRGRPKGTARKTRTVELILTVSGSADGDWQADLRHGTDRVVQGLPIPAAAVSRAAKELHAEISGGIETVLDEARAQHRQRLEQLEAEVNKVKQALAELEDEAE